MTNRFPTSTITASVNESLGTINYLTVRGSEFRQNITGLLRKFKVTKEKGKLQDTEVLHLANLENGWTRKFIVKKVDERELTYSIPTPKKSDDSKSMRDENENTAIVGGLMEGDDQPLIENLLDIQNSLDGSETSSDIEKKDNLSSTTDDSEENNNDKNEKNIKLSYLDSNILFNDDENSSNLFKSDDFADDETILIMPGNAKLEKEDPGVVNPVYLNDDDDLVKGDGSVGTTSDRSSPNLTPPESPMDRSTNSLPGSPTSYRLHMGTQSHRSSISSVRKKGILKKSGSSSTIYGGMEMDNLANSRCVSRNGSINKGKDGYDEEYSQEDTNKFISSDSDYDVQQTTKSIGGHRVKFILETGRPDFVSGSYDDIGIEKMERERIDRIEKGKSLDVTNNENEKGGRKCMIFLGLMFLLAGAIIVGALYGSGRIGNITKYGKGIPASQSPISGSSSAHVVTTPAPIVYVPDTFEVKFEIDSIQFQPVLADHSSDDFKSLTKVLEEKLRDPISYKYDEDFTLKLIKFESSTSNTTSCTVRIRWPEDEVEDEKNKSPTIKDVTEQLEQYIKVREGHIGGHHISSKSLNVENLIDVCQINDRKMCSHLCDFQTTTLMFKCSCPDNLILKNKDKCVDRSSVKPTEKPIAVNIANILEIAQSIGGVVSDIKYEIKQEPTTEKPPTTTTTQPEPTKPINETLTNSTAPPPINATVNNSTMVANGAYANNSKISINESSPLLEVISVEDSELNNEIDVDSNIDTIPEKDGSHKPFLDKKEKSNLIPNNPKKYPIKNNTNFDFISPGTRMEDIAPFNNMSSENFQNRSSLVLGDSPADVRLHMNISLINDNIENMSSLSNTNKTITNKVLSQEIVLIGHVTENNITLMIANEKVIDITKAALLENMANLTSSNEKIPVEKGEYDVNREDIFLRNETLVVNNTSYPEEEITFDSISNETDHNYNNEITGDTIPKEVSFDNISNETEHGFINEIKENNTKNQSVLTIVDEMNVDMTDLTSTLTSNETDHNYNDEITGDTIPKEVSFDSIYNENEHIFFNEIKENNIKNQSVLTIVDEMNVDMTNLTSTLKSFEELPINNKTVEIKSNNLTNEIMEITKTPPSLIIVTSTPWYDPNHANKSPPKYANKTSTTTISTSQAVPSIEVTTESMQFKINQTQNKLVDQNMTNENESLYSDNVILDSVAKQQPVDINSDIENSTLIMSEVNKTKSVGDKSQNDMKQNFTEGSLQFKNESQVLLKTDSDVETSTILSIISSATSRAPCMEDEEGCSPPLLLLECGEKEFLCSEGGCIPNSYKCDGHPHCPNGEDENEDICKCSGEDETKCHVGGCVSNFRLCDGTRNCPDGSDEWNCLRVQNTTQRLQVRKEKEHWMAVCGDNWTAEWSDRACLQLGGVGTQKYTVIRLNDTELPPSRVKLDSTVSIAPTVPMQLTLSNYEECTSNTIVQLSCDYQNTCSSWENESINRAARFKGDYVRDGDLPSLVKLVRHIKPNEPHLCTATVVAPTWVLTSYSCISANGEAKNPNEWSVIAGDSSPKLGEEDTQTRNVHKIRRYPGAIHVDGIWSGDAALLQLNKPLNINKKISPACLSEKSPLPTDSCIIAGWSAKSNAQLTTGIERHLHYVPLSLVKSDICNTTHYPSHILDMVMCAEMNDTEEDICNEDSGSPMMCWDSNEVLHLHGILSDHVSCGKKQHPSIFTALHKLEPWLSSTIGIPQKHKEDIVVSTTSKPESVNSSQTVFAHNNDMQPPLVVHSNATQPSETLVDPINESQPLDTGNTAVKQDLISSETETQMESLVSKTSKLTSVHEHNSNDTFSTKLTSEETS